MIRQLTISEILRAWDIPKKLDNDILTNLENECLDQNVIWQASPTKISFFISLALLVQPETRRLNVKFSTTPMYQSIISGDYNPVSVQESSIDKSVKADDAAVPISLWNEKLFLSPLKYIPARHDDLLENLRSKFALKWYRKNIFNSYNRYMKLKHGVHWANKLVSARKNFGQGQRKTELLLDGDVGADALGRAVNADWWNWNDGSTLLFWRWPSEVHKEARDGSSFPWIFRDKLPKYKIPQRYPRDQVHKEFLINKVWSPILRRYIEVGFVKSLSGFFCIPKGVSDIRIVYDMTKCGLNAALWSPRFYLPTPDSVFDSIEYRSWMADTDQGEMFLNYFTDPCLQQYMGVDVTEVVRGSEFDTGKERIWMRWNRWPMGVRQSPYATTRMCAIGLECIKGNRLDRNNVWAWEYIDLNLPGMAKYDPSQPWVSKRTTNGSLAPDTYVFVDDGRQTGPTEGLCDRATRSVASEGNFLGEQDASRKRRKSSQTSGAWIGAIYRASKDTIGVLSSQEKWDKAKGLVDKWLNQAANATELNRKELERDRGFMVHIAMIYPSLVPYLKGFHLALETWRPDHDQDGWKLPANEWIRIQTHFYERGEDPPHCC